MSQFLIFMAFIVTLIIVIGWTSEREFCAKDILLVALLIAQGCCLIVGSILEAKQTFNESAIKEGHAEYVIVNKVTGKTKWQWKKIEEPKK